MKIGVRSPLQDTAVRQRKSTGAGKVIAAADESKRMTAWTLTPKQTGSGVTMIQMLIGRGGGSRTSRTTGCVNRMLTTCCCILPSAFVAKVVGLNALTIESKNA